MTDAELVFYAKIVLQALLLGLCTIACFTDLSKGRVPNWLTFPCMLVGLAIQYVVGGWNTNPELSLAQSLAGLATGGGFMVILYYMGGLGGGDVKLFAAVGALAGQRFTTEALLNSCILGGILAVFQIVFQWLTHNPNHPKAGEKQDASQRNPEKTIQVIPEEPELTVEQKKEKFRKEKETKKEAEEAAKEEVINPSPKEVELHPDDPEADIAEDASSSDAQPEEAVVGNVQPQPQPGPESVLATEEEKKSGVPFGFAISLGVVITLVMRRGL